MRAIIDSSICIGVTRSKISPEEWKALQEVLRSRFGYFVSPLTFIELISGLGKGEDDYYHKNLEALNVLLAPGNRFLTFPVRFVLDRVFGIARPHPGFEPSDFRSWASILLGAGNKKQLADGNVDLAELSRDATFGFNFDVIAKSQEAGIAEHVRIYDDIRAKNHEDCKSVERWANPFLAVHDVELTVENRMRVSERINAALTLAMYLCNLARTSTYKFEKHGGDWIDGQHLYYLADPDLYIVTGDTSLREKIKASPQAKRLLTPEKYSICDGGVRALSDTQRPRLLHDSI